MKIRRTVLVAWLAVIALVLFAWAIEGSIVTRAVADESADEGLEEFVPSEKVPADDAVAFPVDI